MKKIYTVIISLLMLTNAFAQVEENRTVEDFQVLNVSNALEVVLTQGETNEVIIEGATPEDIAKVKTEVKDGKLILYTKGKTKWKANIKVLITFKDLQRIEQSGASEISTTNAIRTEDFSIKGSGAIEADLELEVNRLSIDFSGASDIKLSGTAESFDLTLSGASDLKASGFKAKNVKVDISGASDVRVYAEESITGKASGASTINVQGNPSERNIETTIASSSSYNGVEVEKEFHFPDTTKINWGDKNFMLFDDSTHVKIPKKRMNHWAGIDLGINGFLNADNSFDLSNDASLVLTDPEKVTQFMELNYRKSWTFSINFMEFFIKVKEHHFGIVTGLGTEWNNYELRHNVRLTSKGGSNIYPVVDEFNEDYTWGEVDTDFSYSKNRFKTWFINAPLLLEVNTGNNKNKSFHISAGAIFGFNLQTKIKYKYKDVDGSTKKEKDKQSFNTNPFRVSLTTRVGVGRFNVFATYSLTPLFENSRGPELYPFTVGVTLLGF
ncbi:MAG: DUF2807 domain-containing protein [Flavobacteriales bacterium]|nr:DUF2807 domain-containing protein [Flavobacteriales bacterium]